MTWYTFKPVVILSPLTAIPLIAMLLINRFLRDRPTKLPLLNLTPCNVLSAVLRRVTGGTSDGELCPMCREDFTNLVRNLMAITLRTSADFYDSGGRSGCYATIPTAICASASRFPTGALVHYVLETRLLISSSHRSESGRYIRLGTLY
jgi:hypothetical protein